VNLGSFATPHRASHGLPPTIAYAIDSRVVPSPFLNFYSLILKRFLHRATEFTDFEFAFSRAGMSHVRRTISLCRMKEKNSAYAAQRLISGNARADATRTMQSSDHLTSTLSVFLSSLNEKLVHPMPLTSPEFIEPFVPPQKKITRPIQLIYRTRTRVTTEKSSEIPKSKILKSRQPIRYQSIENIICKCSVYSIRFSKHRFHSMLQSCNLVLKGFRPYLLHASDFHWQ
jgi:hypothetical protein